MSTVLDYQFDEAAGSPTATETAGDTSTTGTFQGDATTDGSGSAVFDGHGDYLEIAPSPEFGLDQGTIVLSATQVSGGGKQALFSVDSMNYDDGGHLTVFINNSGQIEVRHQTDSTSHVFRGGSVDEGEPFDIAYSWGPDGSNLFVNGVEVDSGSEALTLAADKEPIVLGAGQTRSGDGVADNMKNYFDGSIHSFQMHDQSMAATAPPICFAADTRITSPKGVVEAGELQVGQSVITPDGPMEILAVSRQRFNRATLAALPWLGPVAIAAGTLGNDRRLRLSRQHGLAMRTASGAPVLVRARHLADAAIKGVRFAHSTRQIEYVHLLLARHTLVRAEGIWCETLWPGNAEALQLTSVDTDATPLCKILSRAEAVQGLRSGAIRPLHRGAIQPVI